MILDVGTRLAPEGAAPAEGSDPLKRSDQIDLRSTTSSQAAGDLQPVTVAVVIPAHRPSAAFVRCLDAVGRLDPSPTELIVVVDGGDKTVTTWATHAGATVVVLDDPSGPGAARNAGAAAATGDVVLFLDSDVEAAPDVVGRIATTLAARPDLAAVIGSYDDHPAEQNWTSQYKNLLNHHVHHGARPDGFTFWGACGAVRRDVFQALGGFDEDYVDPSIEDIELGYRMRAAGLRILVDRDVQVKHLKRWTPASLLRSDVVHRALPWSALILRTRRMENDLNVGVRDRATAALALSVPVVLGLALWWPLAGLLAPLAVVAILALDRSFLALLGRRTNARTLALGAGWHLFYHLYSAVGFLAAVGRHLVFGGQPIHDPWPGSPRRRPAPQAPGDLPAGHAATRLPDHQLLRQSRRVRLGVPIVVLFAGAAALMPAFRTAVGVDGLPHIRTAELYAQGDLGRAVNPYWGPLYSWLLVPFLKLGIEPLLATKLLQTVVGAATLLALRRLCLACDIRAATADGMAMAAIPLVLYLAFANVHAELLASALLLLFCSELVPTQAEGRRGRVVRAGLWGGLAFLAEPYALPVVMVATLLTQAARAWDGRRVGVDRPVRRAGGLTLATLAAVGTVVVPWVVVLSVDAGSLTVGRSAGYEIARQGPTGLVEPPYAGALFAWEDPGSLPGKPAGPAFTDSIPRPDGASLPGVAQLVPVLALAAVGAFVAFRRPGRRALTPLAAVLAVVAVYLAGSPFTDLDGPYLWFVLLALAPFVATAIDLPFLRPGLDRRDPRYPLARFGGFALLALALTIQSVFALPWQAEGRQVARVAKDLQASAAPSLRGARVASTDRWAASSVLCFHLGCTYLGRTTGVAPGEVERRADYVLEWDGSAEGDGAGPADLDRYPAVARVDDLVVRSTDVA